MPTDKNISKYINEAVKRSTKESNRHMTSLKEFFDHRLQMVAELVESKPTRDEVRIIAREEMIDALKPINAKLDFLNDERKLVRETLADFKNR